MERSIPVVVIVTILVFASAACDDDTPVLLDAAADAAWPDLAADARGADAPGGDAPAQDSAQPDSAPPDSGLPDLGPSPAAWALRGGGGSGDRGKAIAVDQAGRVYVAGSFAGSATFGVHGVSGGGTGHFVARIGPRPSISWVDFDWATSLGGNEIYLWDMDVDPAGNSFVTGDYQKPLKLGSQTLAHGGGRDFFVAKLDGAGKIVWALGAGNSGDERGYGVAADGAGNVYVTGNCFGGKTTPLVFGGKSVPCHGSSIFVLKLDPQGKVLWISMTSGDYSVSEHVTDIAADSNGATLSGTMTGTGAAHFGTHKLTAGTTQDIVVARISSTGSYLWAQRGVGPDKEDAYALALDAKGNSYLLGSYTSTLDLAGKKLTTTATWEHFVMKLAPTTGAEVWTATLQGLNLRHLAATPGGQVFLTGYFAGSVKVGALPALTAKGKFDIFVAKLSAAGAPVWARRAGSAGPYLYDNDVGQGVATDSSGAVYVTGGFFDTVSFDATPLTSSSNAKSDVFVWKIAPTMP